MHYAATQHEADACRLEPVAIVGGGNSAGQAALFLADKVPRVYLIVRDELSQDMSRYLIAQLEANPQIQVLPHCEVREVIGETTLRSVVVEDRDAETADSPRRQQLVRVHRRRAIHVLARRHACP